MNAYAPNVFTPGKSTLTSAVQPENALDCMSVTESGMLTLTSDEQPLNALPYIAKMLSGISMDVRPPQFSNADEPTNCTLSGIIIEESVF